MTHQPTQHEKIVRLLKMAGRSGVSCWDITTKTGALQYNTRIKELRAKGFDIVSVRRTGEKHARFYLGEYAPKPEPVIKSKVIFDASTFQMVLL